MLNHGVMFNLGSAKVCSHAIFETYFAYHKHIWNAETYYYLYLYLIVLFSLTATLQLINFTASLLPVLVYY